MYQLVGASVLEVEIKKSRFIVTCVPVHSAEEVQSELNRLNRADATHNCWAWRIGEAYRFNDDGEPGGSAGRPMLAAIDGQSMDGVLAHVVRYFGGIKLGVGGLVRAYGNSVAECLRTAEKQEIIPYVRLKFSVDFSDTYAVYGLINQKKLCKLSETYTSDGVIFELSVQVAVESEIRLRLNDATRARITWIDEDIHV